MIELIIDTDIGNDSDDAGALAIAHQLENLGECKILAITSSTSRLDGALCIDAINQYYHKSHIPVGMSTKSSFLDETTGYGQYSRAIVNQYKTTLTHVPTSTNILRQALAKTCNKVVFVTLGPLNNIKDLLMSPPDQYSPMNGHDLVQTKVEKFVVMGGDFSKEDVIFMLDNQKMIAEWNILQDVDSAQYVIHQLDTPILFVPYAVGLIKTGHRLFSEPNYESPIKLAYKVHNNGPRQSWDPIAVYVAVRGTKSLFHVSEQGKVIVHNDGRTLFTPNQGNHQYLINHIDESKTIQCLDEYIL
ncbi:nucleoside hydrolase [Paracholeplasma manati]|uniref:nucleoside hydrolase n=1 Tax=Paracholeplasma manati TaxID=591373 RepID=UPI0024080B11|nr:nucleoside hydrolase [Paracholeplasma manati]MDG0888972.1 nucleoside hydrolase [Paracholeplasma manati]